MSVRLYLAFLALIAVSRLFELAISKRNQTRMLQGGARPARDPVYPWMVALHTATLLGAAAEVVWLDRPWIPALGWSCLSAWAAANVLRFWVIRTLAHHWNTQVVDSTSLGVISSGPYRWVRHPNYVAVFVEMIAIPALHGAWLTLLGATLGHLWVLTARIGSEEKVLLADPEYRRVMGPKPRFVPRFWSWTMF